MARDIFGFTFQKIPPRDITSPFDPSVPPKLVECIGDLLKYDPSARLTSLDCLEHPYILESIRIRSHVPPALSVSTSLSGHSTGLSTPVSQFTSSPRVVQRQPSGHSIPSGHRRVHSSRACCAKLVVRYAFPPLPVQPTPLPLPSRPC
ncbi:hypothetical protein V8E52_008812 [Russula decolorans]